MPVYTATILSEGQTMDPAYGLLSIEVSRELNRIPAAHLVLVDGNVAQGEFPVSNSDFFKPGKEVEIKLRYEGETDVTVFKGKVMGHGIRAGLHGSTLSVELKDAAVKLAHQRRNVVYRNLSDSDIFSQIISDAGLTAGDIATTKPQHPEIIQYNATDWDFILSRADIYGLGVLVSDGTVSANTISLSGNPAHTFELGLSELYELEIDMDASHQYADLESVAWDLESQKLTTPSKASEFALSQGNLQGGNLAKDVGYSAYRLSHPVPLDPDELQGWANGRMVRSRMSMIRGRLSVLGTTAIKPLDIMEIAGTSDRFNGKTIVTGVRQLVDDRGWQTDVQFGLSSEWFSRQPDIQDVFSAGLLPAISGLQIGVVDAFEEDPDGQFRVRITSPAIDAEDGVIWARLATPDGGIGRGYFFRPEQGDEVVVGFFNNDPRRAVVLGSLYSSTNNPPDDYSSLSEDNINKGIVSKAGTKINFVDAEKPSLVIQTPGNNKITVDDDGKMIELSDQNGNTITMNSDGVKIKTGGDFKVDASGNVEIKGAKVDVK